MVVVVAVVVVVVVVVVVRTMKMTRMFTHRRQRTHLIVVEGACPCGHDPLAVCLCTRP